MWINVCVFKGDLVFGVDINIVGISWDDWRVRKSDGGKDCLVILNIFNIGILVCIFVGCIRGEGYCYVV